MKEAKKTLKTPVRWTNLRTPYPQACPEEKTIRRMTKVGGTALRKNK